MKINNIVTEAKEFAFDGCHKIYLIESSKDKKEAIKNGYNLLPISKLKESYDNSCSLKFINSWDLQTTFAEQGRKAKIVGND
jgi:hypothetical protein